MNMTPLMYLTFTAIVLKFLFKWRYKNVFKILQKEETNCQYYHQCKFINMKQFNCRAHLIGSSDCCEECSVIYEKEITSFIASAKLSICICMYIISLKDIIFTIIEASKKGVKVRVITDSVMLKTDVMQKNFGRLEKYGSCKITA